MRQARRSWWASVAALPVMLLVAPATGAAQEPLVIDQVRPGNVFVEGDTPVVRVRAGGDVRWSAVDFRGRPAGDGGGERADGIVTLALPVESTGFYRLHVTAGSASADTTFALLPRTEPALDDGFTYSMQTHFAQGWNPDILVPIVDSIGAEAIRDAQRWSDIEKTKGVYDWGADKPHEKYMAALADAGLEPLISFGRSNDNYDNPGDGGCTPYSAEGRAAFGAFAHEVVTHYGDQITQIGAYNEPNGGHGDYDPGDENSECNADSLPIPHRDIASAVHAAVEGDHVTVTAPDLAAGARGIDTHLDWLRSYLGTGGVHVLDTVSLHTYRPSGKKNPDVDCTLDDDICRPEGLAKEQIQPVRDILAGLGEDKPIWITEMGWRSNDFGDQGEQTQAAYLPRAHVLAMQADVPRFNWYNLMDHEDGTFGLIRSPDDPLGPYTPKPALVAYAVMTSRLSGLTYDGQEEAPEFVHSHRFAGGEDPTRVLWTTDDDRDQSVRLAADRPISVTNNMGATQTHPPTDGHVRLTLTDQPVYVQGHIDGITEG